MKLLLFVWAATFLSAAEISIGEETLTVEIANTPQSRRKGLMGREELKEGRGMLFVFEKPDILSFWMKNTKIPLSIAFFDQNQVLINEIDMEPEGTGYTSSAPAVYALEVPRGWLVEHQIEPGMKFSFRHH